MIIAPDMLRASPTLTKLINSEYKFCLTGSTLYASNLFQLREQDSQFDLDFTIREIHAPPCDVARFLQHMTSMNFKIKTKYSHKCPAVKRSWESAAGEIDVMEIFEAYQEAWDLKEKLLCKFGMDMPKKVRAYVSNMLCAEIAQLQAVEGEDVPM